MTDPRWYTFKDDNGLWSVYLDEDDSGSGPSLSVWLPTEKEAWDWITFVLCKAVPGEAFGGTDE